MVDTPSVLVLRDGSTPSAARNIGVMLDPAGVEYIQHVLRSDGAPVDGGSPLPVADAAAAAALTAILAGVVAGATGAGQAAALIDLAAILAKLQGTLTVAPVASPTASVASTPVTVGTGSVQLAAAGTMTKGWCVQNTTLTGAGYVDLCWGATAVLGSGFLRVFPSSSRSHSDVGGVLPPPGTPMTAIASVAGQTVVVTVSN